MTKNLLVELGLEELPAYVVTSSEKQLGEKANQLRIENYANLREKGNRIWHGKLAGQLLADVLEQDFMEAEIQEDRDGTDN